MPFIQLASRRTRGSSGWPSPHRYLRRPDLGHRLEVSTTIASEGRLLRSASSPPDFLSAAWRAKAPLPPSSPDQGKTFVVNVRKIKSKERQQQSHPQVAEQNPEFRVPLKLGRNNGDSGGGIVVSGCS